MNTVTIVLIDKKLDDDKRRWIVCNNVNKGRCSDVPSIIRGQLLLRLQVSVFVVHGPGLTLGIGGVYFQSHQR